MSPPEKTMATDMDRVLDKLDAIGTQISDIAIRLAKLEPLADQHKDLSGRVGQLEQKVVALETKLAVFASLAAAGGGAIGLGLSKVFGAG